MQGLSSPHCDKHSLGYHPLALYWGLVGGQIKARPWNKGTETLLEYESSEYS